MDIGAIIGRLFECPAAALDDPVTELRGVDRRVAAAYGVDSIRELLRAGRPLETPYVPFRWTGAAAVDLLSVPATAADLGVGTATDAAVRRYVCATGAPYGESRLTRIERGSPKRAHEGRNSRLFRDGGSLERRGEYRPVRSVWHAETGRDPASHGAVLSTAPDPERFRHDGTDAVAYRVDVQTFVGAALLAGRNLAHETHRGRIALRPPGADAEVRIDGTWRSPDAYVRTPDLGIVQTFDARRPRVDELATGTTDTTTRGEITE